MLLKPKSNSFNNKITPNHIWEDLRIFHRHLPLLRFVRILILQATITTWLLIKFVQALTHRRQVDSSSSRFNKLSPIMRFSNSNKTQLTTQLNNNLNTANNSNHHPFQTLPLTKILIYLLTIPIITPVIFQMK